eukprot:7934014-Ditylum_brightwellii.AAC.1
MPGKKAAKAKYNDAPPNAAAQIAADAGNPKVALNILTHNAPPALYNDSLYNTVLELYPQKGAGNSNTIIETQEKDVINIYKNIPQTNLPNILEQ